MTGSLDSESGGRAAGMIVVAVMLATVCGASEQWGPGMKSPPIRGEIAFETTPDAGLEAAILAASPDYTRAMVGIDDQQGRYVHARIDLNGDGTDEVFVYLLGTFFCGTGGCNLLLFSDGPMGYSLISEFPVSRTPVIVSAESTNGWKNLVRRESGGGMPPSWVTHTFDGERYIEHERSDAEAEPPGAKVLAGEVSFDAGIPLAPQS